MFPKSTENYSHFNLIEKSSGLFSKVSNIHKINILRKQLSKFIKILSCNYTKFRFSIYTTL